jgi:hypothetical protein
VGQQRKPESNQWLSIIDARIGPNSGPNTLGAGHVSASALRRLRRDLDHLAAPAALASLAMTRRAAGWWGAFDPRGGFLAVGPMLSVLAISPSLPSDLSQREQYRV